MQNKTAKISHQAIKDPKVQRVDLGRGDGERLFIQQRNRKSQLAVSLGLAVNIFLALIKTTVGILGHSPALLAEGVNSTSDVAYYGVGAVFIRLSRKPADQP